MKHTNQKKNEQKKYEQKKTRQQKLAAALALLLAGLMILPIVAQIFI